MRRGRVSGSSCATRGTVSSATRSSAQPHRKTFWTLSAWRDQAALDAFVQAQPHHGIVDQYRPTVTARFASWTMERAELPNARSQARGLWAEGKARLATADSTGA